MKRFHSPGRETVFRATVAASATLLLTSCGLITESGAESDGVFIRTDGAVFENNPDAKRLGTIQDPEISNLMEQRTEVAKAEVMERESDSMYTIDNGRFLGSVVFRYENFDDPASCFALLPHPAASYPISNLPTEECITVFEAAQAEGILPQS